MSNLDMKRKMEFAKQQILDADRKLGAAFDALQGTDAESWAQDIMNIQIALNDSYEGIRRLLLTYA